MKKVYHFLSKNSFIFSFYFLFSLVFSSECSSFLIGDIDNDNKIGLSEAVYALQVSAGLNQASDSTILNVPSNFSTIQEAISAAKQGDTIKVSAGIYDETITISSKKNIKLQGADRDTTTIKGNSTDSTLNIINSNGVEIVGFLIRDGIDGIRTIFSSVVCRDNRLEYNNDIGLNALYNSFVLMENTLAKNNSGHGSSIFNGSSAVITNCEFSLNGGNGLKLDLNSNATIENNTFSKNNDDGIYLQEGASIEYSGNNINSNIQNGLHVVRNSTAHSEGGNTFTNNAVGIEIFHGSNLTIQYNDDSVRDVISSNLGPGIRVELNSELFFESGDIIGNNGHGLVLIADSSAKLGSNTTIKENNGYGINCSDQAGDSKYYGTVGNFGSVGTPDTRNTLGETNCTTYW